VFALSGLIAIGAAGHALWWQFAAFALGLVFRYSRRSQKIKPYQRDAIFHSKRFGIVEGTTKSGKTYCCLVWLFEQFLTGKLGWQYWWVAPSIPQAKIAYRRIRRAINRLPAHTRQFFKFNDSELTLTGPNGQVMMFKTGEKPDLLYGDDVHAVVIDECTRVREEAWHALISTLTKTEGRARLIGNVKGRKNWAYVIARKADPGTDPLWHYAKITADDAVKAGVLKQSVVDEAEQSLPHDFFRELFYAEAAENRACPFPPEHLRECLAPESESEAVVWGWDLAKSLDFTVGIGLDEDGYTARGGYHEWQQPWEECEVDIIRITDGAPAMVDESGVGNPIVERLQRQADNFEGFNFSGSSRNIGGMGKQQLMEFLRSKIIQHAVHFPEPIIKQMAEFEYEYTRTGARYSAREGMHDDRVVAAALSTLMWDAKGYGAVPDQRGRVPSMPPEDELKAAMKEILAEREAAAKLGGRGTRLA
jgi:hypothetical protein